MGGATSNPSTQKAEQEGHHEFRASLGYIVRPYLQNQIKPKCVGMLLLFNP